MVSSAKKAPFLSVILPVYNVEQYLPQCLDSILAQSMQDFELICVNDGSTDNSLAVLKEYAKKSDKIQVITISNSGVGITRNTAMSLVKGSFLTFLDSDDYIQSEYFKSIADVVTRYPDIDIIQFDYYSFEDGSDAMKYDKSTITDFAEPYEKFAWKQRCPHSLHGTRMFVWDKVYRTEFLKQHDLQFPNYPLGEDVLFVILSIILSETIVYIPLAYYYYRLRKGSATHTVSAKYAETIDLIKYCNNKMVQLPILQQYKEELYVIFVRNLKCAYYRLPTDMRAQFLIDAHAVLPPEYYKKFLRTSRPTEPWYTWLFSASKKWLDCDGKLSKFYTDKSVKRVKCYRILGMTFIREHEDHKQTTD